ncbi:hypothetical protein [Shouchella lonarensis]|uniref:Uncharacterized protein n=1 Tax=Shouchella lonarensis TaxID=1464122 RepID=A0A1G6K1A5_9BACI|nr:hypothetical protein [Shouchella lonarensis]SDC24651.1 hypothetical protein SAMN05421737_106156 [Shouchella lonarensis]
MFKKMFVSMIAVLIVLMSGSTFVKASDLVSEVPVIEGPDIVCMPIGSNIEEILKKYYKGTGEHGQELEMIVATLDDVVEEEGDYLFAFIDSFDTDKPGMHGAILAIETAGGEFEQRMIDIVVGCPELPIRN